MSVGSSAELQCDAVLSLSYTDSENSFKKQCVFSMDWLRVQGADWQGHDDAETCSLKTSASESQQLQDAKCLIKNYRPLSAQPIEC